jgi:hypothetical protein
MRRNGKFSFFQNVGDYTNSILKPQAAEAVRKFGEIELNGVKVGPFAMVDRFGTPHTEALHVVERYRLIDYDAALEWQERGLKDYLLAPGADSAALVDSDYKGKGLQLEFTVEDEGVFTMPWSGIVTYRRGIPAWLEFVCAENLRATYVTRDSAVPRAEKPDF